MNDETDEYPHTRIYAGTPEEPVAVDVLFPLGNIVITPAAFEAFRPLGDNYPLHHLLLRHQAGDWGSVTEADKRVNDRHVATGGRLISAYVLPGGQRVWITTDTDRSSFTTISLPGENVRGRV